MNANGSSKVLILFLIFMDCFSSCVSESRGGDGMENRGIMLRFNFMTL